MKDLKPYNRWKMLENVYPMASAGKSHVVDFGSVADWLRRNLCSDWLAHVARTFIKTELRKSEQIKTRSLDYN